MPEHTPGYAAALGAAEHQGYIQQLANQLEQASQFRIPCPGHPYGAHADLRVERRPDGTHQQWAILRDHEAWTGTRWQSRSDLHRHEIYRYTRDDALAEAARIAPNETTAFQAYVAQLRAETQGETPE